MNALPRYNYPPLPPDPTRRRMVRRRPRRNPHQAVAAETSFKLGVNCVLAIAALTALIKLVPYNLAQQTKFKEIRAEVSELEGRVSWLRADLNRQFDPQQAMSIMQEASIRVDPRQRQVVWLPPGSSTAQVSPGIPSTNPQGIQPDHHTVADPDETSTNQRFYSADPAFYPPASLETRP